jgi:hypothetical protein
MKSAPLLLLLATGCADQLPLVGAPCPCAAGTACDYTINQCVAAPSGSNDAGFPVGDLDGALPTDSDGGAANPNSLQGCKELGIATVEEFETKFIAPRCGMSKCHGPMSVFPPRNLHIPSMIRPALVGKKSSLNCKEDYYVDRLFPGRSFVLAKIWAGADTVTCPSGGRPDSGGTRMPNKTDMPTIVGDRLTLSELQCFTWWVWEVRGL